MLTSLSTGDQQPVDHSASRLTVSSASPSSISVDPTRLSGLGRAVPQTLAGLPLVSVQTDGTADPDLIQLGYSDGVWMVSVFQSRGVMSGRPAHSVLDPQLAAYRTDGTPQMASWQSADAVITVVTDGPESLLAQVVHSLPHDQHRTPTRMERIQAGWSRIVTSMFG